MRALSLFIGLIVVSAVASTSSALGVGANARVTRDDTASSYLRYDGSSDATMAACSTGRRSQNEPTVAVDPHNTSVITAGANDYCAAIVNGDVWAGYYRSTDGGSSWQDSLVPGYPADTSAGGTASPAHGSCSAAGDPSQAFDNAGRLFYSYICFNRGKPVNGGVYVTRYTDDGGTYDRTVLVKKGAPSALFNASGLFQDKDNIAVDQTNGSHSGNVYVAWSQYTGQAGNNAVLVSRSTDHGLTFSQPVRATPVALGTASFADLAVGPDGAVYVTFINYPSTSNPSTGIWLVKSTDGGVTFGPPALVASIVQFDSSQFSGNGASDCGDGPFACPTGFTFSRFFSSSAVAADATGVHVVWAARTAEGGQSKIFVRNSPDGVSWPTPAATIDTVAAGHQWFPRLLRLACRPRVFGGPSAGEHRLRRELRRRREHVRGPVLERRRELERDPGLLGREQLRLGDARLAPGRLLGRLPLHLGSRRHGEGRLDRLPRPRARHGSSRDRCRRRRGRLRRLPAVHVRAERHQCRLVLVAAHQRSLPLTGRARREHLRGESVELLYRWRTPGSAPGVRRFKRHSAAS